MNGFEHTGESYPSCSGRLDRRTLLRGTVAGTALGAVSAAFPGVGVAEGRRWAVPPHGSAQDIQQAIDDAAAAGGGTVYLPPGTYSIDRTVRLSSGVVLEGAGAELTHLVDAPLLGAQAVLAVEGTDAQSVSKAGVRHLSVRNGAASDGAFTASKDGIRIRYAADVELTGVGVTEIAGAYGVRVQNTDRITATGCHFYRCTYSMFMVLPDCTDVIVRDSTFDTLTTQTAPNCYTLATGASVRGGGQQRWTRGLTVENCRFVNNPRWEGLDTHGAEQVVFRGNYIENCYFGILVANASNYVAEPVTQDVVVEHNTIIQGNGRPGGYGIVVKGAAARTRNVVVRNNHIRGFGGVHPSIGAIQLYGTEQTQILDNTIEDFGINAITLYYGAFDTLIAGNTIRNAAPAADGTTTAVVRGDAWGVHGAVVRDNVVVADAPTQQVDYFINAVTTNQSWQIGDNDLSGVRHDPPFSRMEFLPVFKDEAPVSGPLQQKAGDILLDTALRPAWRVGSPSAGFGALDTSTVAVLVDMQAGSPRAVLRAGGSYDWRSMPPGMNVVVGGAGTDGGDLPARVVLNSGAARSGVDFVLELDTAASVTVSSAPVRFQGLAFEPIA
ncbi:right-handed parallel beta-helix repeat-containing protein [Saccharopolyspora sp. NPDC002376]